MAKINIEGFHIVRGPNRSTSWESEPHGYVRIPSGAPNGAITFDIPFCIEDDKLPKVKGLVVSPIYGQEKRAWLIKAIQQAVALLPTALLTDDEVSRLSPWAIAGCQVELLPAFDGVCCAHYIEPTSETVA